MGTNAQRRRAAKLEVSQRQPQVSSRLPGRRPTKTSQRLRKAAAQITTRQQFEECVAAAHPDNQGAIRTLLEPLLAPGLPCCGVAMLAAVTNKTDFEHTPHCPTRNLVVLHE